MRLCVLFEKTTAEEGKGEEGKEEGEKKMQRKREGDVVGVDAWANAVQLESLMVSDPTT